MENRTYSLRLTGLRLSALRCTAGLGTLLFLSTALLGQAVVSGIADGPVTSDWSDHHIIFSRPATAKQTEHIQKDIRYWRQLARQSAKSMPEIAAEFPGAEFRFRSKHHRMHRDWSQDLGSGATIGATNFPAKYSFQATTANCASAAQPDFVVYGTGLLGSSTQASIMAFDNLYAGCSGTVPTVYWAYNTGGQVTTSPVFSPDGTQVAFVQNDGAGHGMLVLVKWAASSSQTAGNPLTLTRVTNAEYPSCVAPCMTTGLLEDTSGNPHNDTNSSVYYAYGADTAYIGDDSGWLHQISPVFLGVPAEITSAGWPVELNPLAATALTSPVFDSTSGVVFVADAGGFLYRIGPETAFVAMSSQLDFSSAEGGSGIVQGPIVDSTAELVYVFASSDGSTNCVGHAACAAVYQLGVDFPEGNFGQEVRAGASTVSGSAPSPLYLGTFDSTYENSNDATGNLYVCGNTGGPPILYQVPISASAFGPANPGPVLSTSIGPTPCSPVSDIFNPNAAGGATEWMYASVQTKGSSSGCSSAGCVFNFKDTPWAPSTTYHLGEQVLDSNFQIQVVGTPGTSAATVPSWSTTVGAPTTDGGVQWINQGVASAFTPAVFAVHTLYSAGNLVLDSNNNIERCTTAGRSGGLPTWMTAPGAVTTEGSGVTWENLGAPATAALPVAGGTSGIIMDNTVGSGTLLGASQIYFSTLSSQACGTSGTGGCAVQASQSALQ